MHPNTPVKRLGEAFDPLQDCVALTAKKKKSARVKPISVEVIILPKSHPLILPRGMKRHNLIKEGRVETLQIKRTMSSLQLRNATVAGFQHLKVKEWDVLAVRGGKLVKCENQVPGVKLLIEEVHCT